MISLALVTYAGSPARLNRTRLVLDICTDTVRAADTRIDAFAAPK